LVGAPDAQMGELVGVVGQPGGARLLEPGLEHVPVSALDEPRADRQSQLERARVVEAVEAAAQAAVGLADRGRFFRRARGFQVGLQRFQDLWPRPPTEPALLGSTPAPGPRAGARRRRGGQVFGDVVEVAPERARLWARIQSAPSPSE